MMKKFIYGFIAAVALMLCSCGSTKTESPEEVLPQAPVVEESEEVTEEQPQEAAEESEEENASEEEAAQKPEEDLQNENQEEASEEELTITYPPLDEIEEPEITDLPPEEFYKPEKKEQEEEAPKIEEPIPQEEAEPPVMNTETEEDNPEQNPSEEQTEAQEEESDSQDELGEDEQEAQKETEDETEEEPEEEVIPVPSRSVTLKKGETLVVTYPGSGWIYMGSTSEYNNLASRGRRLGSADTKYTLLAKEAGTQLHHFYKTDNLTGEYIDDYLEVTVLEKKGKSSTIVTAPDYSATVPKKADVPAKSSATIQREKEAAAKTEVIEQPETSTSTDAKQTQTSQQTKTPESTAAKTTSQTTAKTTTANTKTSTSSNTNKSATTTKTAESTASSNDQDSVIVIDDEETVVVEEIEPEEEINLSELLEQSTQAFNNKQYNQAYETLLLYLERSTDSRDQALYLLGQLLEADSPLKNIKEAINTYQSLCDNYPASSYWEKANKRIIYLKRFYIDIH